MPPRRAWKLRVWYEARHDCLGVAFEGSALSTSEDVDRLVKEFVARVRTFERPLDMIVIFDGVAIEPAIRPLFTGARLQIATQLGGRFYRVASTDEARELFAPSMLGPRVTVCLHPDYDSAVKAMLADRKAPRQDDSASGAAGASRVFSFLQLAPHDLPRTGLG